MLFLVRRTIHKWWSRAPWLTLCVRLGGLYAAGYPILLWSEPDSNPIRSLANYTYFFIITVTTVGYGDVVPVSTAGRLTAGVLAIGGIGAAAVAIGNIFSQIG